MEELASVQDISVPAVITWLRLITRVFTEIDLLSWAWGIGGIVLLASSVIAVAKAGVSERYLGMAFLRIAFAIGLWVAAPTMHTGAIDLFAQLYEESHALVGPTLVTGLEYVTEHTGEVVAAAVGVAEVDDNIASLGVAGGGAAVAGASAAGGNIVARIANQALVLLGRKGEAIGQWWSNVTSPFRLSPAKMLAKFGRILRATVLRWLPGLIQLIINLLLMPYVLAAMMLWVALIFYPISVALIPTPEFGILSFSTTLATVISSLMLSYFTPLFLAIGLNLAIVTPLTQFVDTAAQAVEEVRTTATDYPIFAEYESAEEATDFVVGWGGAILEVVTLPLTLAIATLSGVIVGLVGGIIIMFRMGPMLVAFIAGGMARGMSGVGMTVPRISGGGRGGGGAGPPPGGSVRIPSGASISLTTPGGGSIVNIPKSSPRNP